jgi:transposase
LREQLERARRSGKRQAAPFSKGAPKPDPKRPGRRPGKAYGTSARRPIPDRVDDVVVSRVPERCPDCRGTIDVTDVLSQFQTELPKVQPHVTRFDVELGHCRDCGRCVQGRDARQNSDALGAAASHLGPRALALAANLNKGLGLSLGKVAELYRSVFGIPISRGGLAHAIARVADALVPTYQLLIEQVRQSQVVTPDETGWRVGGETNWLWIFATESVTVYAILPGRGFEQSCEILPADFAGALTRAGWAPYRKYTKALHQSCDAHLLRRCGELLETAQRGAARVPHAVRRILLAGLSLRDRRDRGELSPHGVLVATGRLEARMARLLRWQPADDENRKLLDHLWNERDALFTFLRHPNVPATNYRAEQAVRPAVVNRKVWGGNRTWNGAVTQDVIMSVLRTSWQQGHEPVDLIAPALRSPTPSILSLTGPPVTH